MNTRTIHKIALSLVLGGTLSVDSAIAAPAAGIKDKISQTPLSVGTAGSVPNIMLMIDNSGSMSGNVVGVSPTITRMAMAKAAAKKLVDDKKVPNGEKAKVRLGLTTFDATKWDYPKNKDVTLTGGQLLSEVKDLDETHATAIKNKIDALSPDGSTALAETLADIGRYFCRINTTTPLQDSTTQLTLYPTGTAGASAIPSKTIDKTVHEIFSTSNDNPDSTNDNGLTNSAGTAAPILNYCQKSAVILVTDGLPNRDREIGQFLRNYSGECGTTATTAATSPKKCDATPVSERTDGTSYNSGPNTMSSTSDGNPVSLNGTSGDCRNNKYNIACKNGTLKDSTYEVFGSDYLDDVAQALYEMDLRPASTWSAELAKAGLTEKPAGAKNNISTYVIGVADNTLTTGSIVDRAAQKGNGKYVFANNQTELAVALDKMVVDIQKGVGSFSAIAANTTSLGVDSALFQAKYDTADWTGDFLALPLSVNEDTNKNGKLDTGEDTNGNSQLDRGGDVLDPAWNAGNKFPVWNSRTAYTYNSSTHIGVKLECANLAPIQKTALGIGTSCATTTDEGVKRLDWLRGDTRYEKVNEVRRTTYTTDPRLTDGLTPDIFRNRARFYSTGTANGTIYKKEDGTTPVDAWLLGDIVNSDAVYVSNEDYGYAGKSASIPEAGTNGATYKTFVDAKTDATSKKSKYMMTYIGANDGYLHGFDARIPPLSSGVRIKDPLAGQELLAYMPNTVFAGNNLKNLSSPDYTHQYFVDGSPKVSDVYYGSAWHTVLVGTTGAGGKGVFALDVTNPSTFAAANPVLWEISNTDAPEAADITEFSANMGYSLPQPSIGRMANGKWAAIVANGYASTNGKAVLYIIDIQTGNILKTIDTGEGSATLKNGLSTPFAADVNQDGIIDAVYAGDLLGNMWKFDVSDKMDSKWDVAYKKSGASIPLFTACFDASSDASCDVSRQAITNKPQVGKVGSTQTPGDVMVYFGTGKYFEDSDNDILNTKTQSFYGIWDKCPLGGSATLCSSTVPKSTLVKQTIMAELTSPANIRVTSPNTVDYSTKNGWHMDFEDPNSTITPKANKGERIVSASLLRGGRIIFVTLIPTPDTTTKDVCIAGSKSESWLMEMDALSGARLKTPALDINGSGTVTDEDTVSVMVDGVATDVPASGVKMKGGSTKTPAVINNPGSDELKFTGSSSGAKPEKIAETPSSTSTSGSERQSWRQL